MEKIIVIDTETTNDIDCLLVYDVGFIIMDITGKIYNSYSFMVADIFLDDFLMGSAYFKEKIPNYWEDIRKGERELRKFSTIKKIFCQVCKENNIKKLLLITASLIIEHYRIHSVF